MRRVSPNEVSPTIIADCRMEIIASTVNSYGRPSMRLRYSVLLVGVIEVTSGAIKQRMLCIMPSTARCT